MCDTYVNFLFLPDMFLHTKVTKTWMQFCYRLAGYTAEIIHHPAVLHKRAYSIYTQYRAGLSTCIHVELPIFFLEGLKIFRNNLRMRPWKFESTAHINNV